MVLAVKLPVSSTNAGIRWSRIFWYSSAMRSMASSGTPRFRRLFREMLAEPGQAQAHLQLLAEVAAAENRAHDHAGPQAVEGVLFAVARILKGLVRGIEEHELQRVGGGDLLGRDFVLFPIVLEIGDEPADVRGHFPEFVRSGHVADGRIPALGRDGAFLILPRREHVPQSLGGPRRERPRPRR